MLAALIVYIAGCLVPVSALWFVPGTPVFSDSAEGDPVTLAYEREIKRDSRIEYAVAIKRAGSNSTVCDVRGGPFTYKTSIGPVVDRTLSWWTQDNMLCNHLAPGSYWVETTWTVVYPLGDLLPVWLDPFIGWVIPPKRVSRISPLFTITEK